MKKMSFESAGDKLIVDVEGFKISFRTEVKQSYVAYGGASNMREYYENIENEEMSSHYLYLEGTEWKRVIHRYVKFGFYTKHIRKENKDLLFMRFRFTGLGNSQCERFKGYEDIIIGYIEIDRNELKLTTENGITYLQTK